MSDDAAFEVTWEAEDGYCGGSAPQHFDIDADEINEDMDDEDLRQLFWDSVESDFQNKVRAVSGDEAEFVAWAKERQAEMREEGEL